MKEFPAITLREIQARSSNINNKSMNELRAALYAKGIEYEDDATRKELIELLKTS